MVPGLLLVAALGSAAVPFLASKLSQRALLALLAIGVAIAGVASVLSFSLFPWTNLVVLLMGLTAGVLIGRLLPAGPGRFLVWLGIFAALDVAQFVLISGGPAPSTGSATPPVPLTFLNFLIPPPIGRFNLGIFDFTMVALMAEWWRLRSGSFWIAELPGLAGFSLTYAFLLVVGPMSLPLNPFLAAGWAFSYALWRLWERRSAPSTGG